MITWPLRTRIWMFDEGESYGVADFDNASNEGLLSQGSLAYTEEARDKILDEVLNQRLKSLFG